MLKEIKGKKKTQTKCLMLSKIYLLLSKEMLVHFRYLVVLVCLLFICKLKITMQHEGTFV